MKALRTFLTLLSILLCSWLFAFSQSPTLTSISPTAIAPGMQVTLTGSGFGSTQGNGKVTLGPQATGTVVSWSSTQMW